MPIRDSSPVILVFDCHVIKLVLQNLFLLTIISDDDNLYFGQSNHLLVLVMVDVR